MAVDDVNRNESMLADYELSLDIKDGKCEPDVVMKKFIDFIKTKEISRFSSTVGEYGCIVYIIYPSKKSLKLFYNIYKSHRDAFILSSDLRGEIGF